MRRLTLLTLIAVLAGSACSSDPEEAEVTTSSISDATESSGVNDSVPASAAPDGTDEVTTSSAENTTPTPEPEPPSTGAVTEDDLTLFIAAAERALEGTSQEAAIFDDPDIYIAIAQTSCDRLSAGDPFEEIAIDLLADLTTDGAEDETRLVGAILGAATQTICPVHANKF